MSGQMRETRWLLGVKEAADLIGVSAKTFRRMHERGETPKVVRVGKLLKWKRTDLKLWLELGLPDRQRFESMADNRRGIRK